jgi:hypothetical protein
VILSNIKGITVPEGAVKQIADSAGRVLWSAKSKIDVAALVIGYTGGYTDQADVVMGDGKTYRLLTLTGSGTLTLDQPVKADVWLCAGGNGGYKGGCAGGGGGKFVQSDGIALSATTVCVVGAGSTQATTSSNGIGGSTVFGAIEVAQETGSYKHACGASGGGGGGAGTNNAAAKGVGDGVSTVPFLEASLFSYHSAGGGGGGNRDRSDGTYEYTGGSGGSNGASGSSRGGGEYTGGDGGEKGGGVGGKGTSSSSTNKGGDATFYGSGGGAGGQYINSSGSETEGAGGSGYQGVIYVRIPYEQ